MHRLCLLLPALFCVTACSSSQDPSPSASTPASSAPAAAPATDTQPTTPDPSPASTKKAPKSPVSPSRAASAPQAPPSAPAPRQAQSPASRPAPRQEFHDGVITHSSDDKDNFTCDPATRTQLLDLLRQYDPDGYSIFTQDHRLGMKTANGKFVFDAFLDFSCEDGIDRDPVSALESSVHESVHDLRGPLNGYLLIGGAVLPDLPFEEPNLFHPSVLESQFPANSYTNYLNERSGPSSSKQFSYLLDEMNAYTHDLHTASSIDGHAPPSDIYTTDRDGMLSLMDFVAAYAERARSGDARAWSALQQEPYRTTVRTLWAQSETVLAENCRHARQGSEISEQHLRNLRSSSRTGGIAALLGRTPAIPAACAN